jgi:hypothetical protein
METDIDELLLRSLNEEEERSNEKNSGQAEGGAKRIQDALKVF